MSARCSSHEDDLVFNTAPATLASATSGDVMDHIDLVFPRPTADTVAVVLRLRNSLLNTVYFYDLMLAGQGARSLDWLGQDLASISYASVSAISTRSTWASACRRGTARPITR